MKKSPLRKTLERNPQSRFFVPETAHHFLNAAQKVVAARERTHGEIVSGQSKIACLWNAYLDIRRDRHAPLDAEDVTAMLQLLKLARMHSGGDNVDDDVDNIGFASKLAEVRAAKRRTVVE